jgi:hypothetical protein
MSLGLTHSLLFHLRGNPPELIVDLAHFLFPLKEQDDESRDNNQNSNDSN